MNDVAQLRHAQVTASVTAVSKRDTEIGIGFISMLVNDLLVNEDVTDVKGVFGERKWRVSEVAVTVLARYDRKDGHGHAGEVLVNVIDLAFVGHRRFVAVY